MGFQSAGIGVAVEAWASDRPVYQEEHAAQLIMARRPNLSPIEGRIHLRRPVDPPFAFPLQSGGGPYI
jgi:hypothetical protein